MNCYNRSKISFWGIAINLAIALAILVFVIIVYCADYTLFYNWKVLDFMQLKYGNNLQIAFYTIVGIYSLSCIVGYAAVFGYKWQPIRYIAAALGFFTSLIVIGTMTFTMIVWGEKQARELKNESKSIKPFNVLKEQNRQTLEISLEGETLEQSIIPKPIQESSKVEAQKSDTPKPAQESPKVEQPTIDQNISDPNQQD